MKKMNRVAAAGMAAILVASALTACSSGNNKPSETPAQSRLRQRKKPLLQSRLRQRKKLLLL